MWQHRLKTDPAQKLSKVRAYRWPGPGKQPGRGEGFGRGGGNLLLTTPLLTARETGLSERKGEQRKSVLNLPPAVCDCHRPGALRPLRSDRGFCRSTLDSPLIDTPLIDTPFARLRALTDRSPASYNPDPCTWGFSHRQDPSFV